MAKVIAIGNPIMGDDGVALKVVQDLQAKLQQLGLEVLFGETDVDYCLGEIEDGDELWIVDATYLGVEPGTVTVLPLDPLDIMTQTGFSLHQLNLLRLLQLEGYEYTGSLVGIEVQELALGVEISPELTSWWSEICERVYQVLAEGRELTRLGVRR